MSLGQPLAKLMFKHDSQQVYNKHVNFDVIVRSFILAFISIKISLRGQSWRSGTKSDCKTDWLWVRSPLEEMKFIFAFLRSGVEAKRGVEFCHLTRNASRIRQKVGNGVS